MPFAIEIEDSTAARPTPNNAFATTLTPTATIIAGDSVRRNFKITATTNPITACPPIKPESHASSLSLMISSPGLARVIRWNADIRMARRFIRGVRGSQSAACDRPGTAEPLSLLKSASQRRWSLRADARRSLQAGGLRAISRWSSPPRRTTPPVEVMVVVGDPGGITAIRCVSCWHPCRGAMVFAIFDRWCRCAQPPANGCEPFGFSPARDGRQ